MKKWFVMACMVACLLGTAVSLLAVRTLARLNAELDQENGDLYYENRELRRRLGEPVEEPRKTVVSASPRA